MKKLASLSILSLLLTILAPSGVFAAPPSEKTTRIQPDIQGGTMPTWKDINSLIADQKYQAALDAALQLRDQALIDQEDDKWTKAQIEITKLRIGLHGYENAVRELVEESRPLRAHSKITSRFRIPSARQLRPGLNREILNVDPATPPILLNRPGQIRGTSGRVNREVIFARALSGRNRDILRLYTAGALVEYANSYGWEIRQRERVISEEEIDIKRWTMEQIISAAHRYFAEVWKDRDSWGESGLGEYASYFNRNNYPERIRGTFRDTVTYLWVQLLADSSYWLPGQSNKIYQLDLETMADGVLDLKPEQLVDAHVQPLLRLSFLLGDLESWHNRTHHPESALEARLERLKILQSQSLKAEDHALLRKNLGHVLLNMDSNLEWWSMGMAQLAEMVRDDETDPQALVRAREIAEEGLKAHEKSAGAQRCRALIFGIDSSSYSLQSMASDGLQHPSLRISYKNLDTLYFRAYTFDLERSIQKGDDSNLLPGYREIPKFIATRKPASRWKLRLPETPDFRKHMSFCTPQLPSKGSYIIVASLREDFDEQSNSLQALIFFASDLVLVQEKVDRSWEITARDAVDGHALAGVELSLYKANWNMGHRLLQQTETATDGRATIHLPDQSARYFLLARRGDDLAFIGNLPWIYSHTPGSSLRAFLYTDRSVYRPGQEIHFKAVIFSGGGEEYRYQTLPLTPLEIILRDANNEEVARMELKSNEFGSAAGSFKIPTGRTLGSWSISSTPTGGSASIRVEEYKRPSFEVSIRDPEEALRLNRQANLSGDALYYFGLPVAEGRVNWRVTREAVYPRWWWWPRPEAQPEVVAAGETKLDADGVFNISFTPEADEGLAKKGLSYRFRLSADAVEPGGETRSASRVFRLGFSAIEAHIEDPKIYYPAGREKEIRIVRSDLDGIPRAGEARWRLIRLQQPDQPLMPAEAPLPEPENPRSYRTPGDQIRPRWTKHYDPEETLGRWKDGPEITSGTLQHNQAGKATLKLPELKPGAYRLVYQTTDAFGTAYEMRQHFITGAAKGLRLQLPVFLAAEETTLHVGQTARLFLSSAFPGQEALLELFHAGRRLERRVLINRSGATILEIPIGPELRGGFSASLRLLRDHQQILQQEHIFVPWDDRQLKLEFESFRDKLHPGEKEKFRIRIKTSEGENLAPGAAEVLAYMYDRSLDIFAPHQPPMISSLYPGLTGIVHPRTTLGTASVIWQNRAGFNNGISAPYYQRDSLKSLNSYGIGGPGRHGGPLLYKMRAGAVPMPSAIEPPEAMMEMDSAVETEVETQGFVQAPDSQPKGDENTANVPLRSNFAETAFFQPSITLDGESSATIQFTAPDSVTEWNLWIHALTRDLRGVSEKKQLKTVKDLMVRPAIPRFFREGDRSTLLVNINNAGESELQGHLRLELTDPESGEDLRAAFGMDIKATEATEFRVDAGKGITLAFQLRIPPRPGIVSLKVQAHAGDFSDGEIRPLPVLPGRMHLMQSRFASLHDRDRRELNFEDMASTDDPSRIDEQLIVGIDAQLFYGVLNALPYLIDYPYECTEQTLNRFLSTGIVDSVFSEFPAVAAMARKMATRDTQLESWDAGDPNRKLELEETPWLRESRGGSKEDLIKILDPAVAEAQRRTSLKKLEKAQTSSGAFPWWPGGPPSPYMTLYVLSGFSHAMEFGVDVPRDVVDRAWRYMHRHFITELSRQMGDEDCCWESITWLNFILSSYPDESWAGRVFSHKERVKMLDFSFSHWKEHSPRLKSYLALCLHRMDREEDAQLVWESVMDSLKIDPDLGAYWAREGRSWLWYNDSAETHAVALRTLSELSPHDNRREGLVQWIFLNKKLNHWKSTRTTAEVIYSLVHYLRQQGQLGNTEKISVMAGNIRKDFVFSPDEYTGNNAQLIISGEEIQPQKMAHIIVKKETPGLAFATATWHFSTEKLPSRGDGDLFRVRRKLYHRSLENGEWILSPLGPGDSVAIGDQVEVELRIKALHAAEYVHLRDPRASGFEPESLHSGYRWDLGISTYEEIRDSGENFFFEWLPAGEYTFRYRIRATMAGSFKLAPALLQSMYAPEFGAYSAGQVLQVRAQ